MQLAYEAQNSIEAHMLLHMLEQAGLSARVDGEYLQGAIGELQAIGLVRVMVDDADYLAARKLIEEWDQQQPKTFSQTPIDQAPRELPSSNTRQLILLALLAFASGVITTAIIYHSYVLPK